MGRQTLASRGGAAASLVVVMLTGGCAGNDTKLDSSNRGSGSRTETTSVENAFIVPRFVPGSCAIQVGDAAELSFTVTNNRTTETERLLGIESDAASEIVMSTDAPVDIAPQSSVAAGQPIEQIGRPAAPDRPFTVVIGRLDDSARPGTSVGVTFRFKEFGDLTLPVPIEACPTQSWPRKNETSTHTKPQRTSPLPNN